MGDLLLFLMFLAGLAWIGWPVSLWAVAAGALTWVTGLAVKRKARLPRGDILAAQLKGVAIGLASVWFVQLAATAFGAIAPDATVRSAEISLAAVRARLSWPVVLASSVGLLAASLSLHRRLTTTKALISTIVGSMLLSGWAAIRLAEARWVESRRLEASADLRALRGAQSRLVAIAEVRRRLARLSPEDREYLTSFLRATESKKHRTEIIAEKAESLATHTPEPAPRPPAGGADFEWAAVERCAVWLGARETENRQVAPRIPDLETLHRVSVGLQARQAAASASTGRFENTLAEALAHGWTRKAWGFSVRDLASAEQLVTSQQGMEDRWPLGADGDHPSAEAEVDASELAFESLDGATTQPEGADPSWASVWPDEAGSPDGARDAGQEH